VRRTPNQTDSNVTFFRPYDQGKITKKDWKAIWWTFNWSSEPSFKTVVFELAWFTWLWLFDASLVSRFVFWCGNLGCAPIQPHTCACQCASFRVSSLIGSSSRLIITGHTSPYLFCPFSRCHGWRNLFQSGGHKCTSNNYRKFLWFELPTATSQALKYDVITYTPYEGLNYTILDKITLLWKRIGEPPEIQIGCYKGNPGQQSHLGSSYDLFGLKKTVWRLRHWNFHLLSFWLALLLLFDVSNNKWEVLMITSPLLSNVRHRAVIRPLSPLHTRPGVGN